MPIKADFQSLKSERASERLSGWSNACTVGRCVEKRSKVHAYIFKVYALSN